jgi:hypothetical protein
MLTAISNVICGSYCCFFLTTALFPIPTNKIKISKFNSSIIYRFCCIDDIIYYVKLFFLAGCKVISVSYFQLIV